MRNSKRCSFANGVNLFNGVNMGVKERKLRQREEVRCQIVDAAWGIVKEEGWNSLSMRKIADKIEYSAPIIYGHFENKEALLLEFTRQGHIRLLEMIKEARGAFEDPALQLEAMWMAYWDFAFANLEYYQLMFGVEMGCCEWQMSQIPEVGEGRELLNGVLTRLISTSKHPEQDPCLKFYSLWSIVHGLISINITRKMYDEQTYRAGGHDLNQAILKDAISGIISRIKD